MSLPNSFDGWLIKFDNVQLPNSFLLADGYEDTPNQRLEIDAYRDANAYLHRDTAPDTKTSLVLNIKAMSYKERIAFDNVINLASLPYVDHLQRRVRVTYWNDEDLEYKSGIFYMSDIKWVIHNIDEVNKDYEYNPVTITLTEY